MNKHFWTEHVTRLRGFRTTLCSLVLAQFLLRMTVREIQAGNPELLKSYTCFHSNESSVELSCPTGSWIHVLKEEHSILPDNCSLNNTPTGVRALVDNSQLGLDSTCMGARDNKCNKTVRVTKSFTASPAKYIAVTYECIKDALTFNLCANVSMESYDTVYLASPSLYEKKSLNVSNDNSTCRCNMKSANITGQFLYFKVQGENKSMHMNKSFLTIYAQNDVYLQVSCEGCIEVPYYTDIMTNMVFTTSNGNSINIIFSGNINYNIWIVIKGTQKIFLRCNVDTDLTTTRSPTSSERQWSAYTFTSESSKPVLQDSESTRTRTSSSIATTTTPLQNNSTFNNTTTATIMTSITSLIYVVYIVISIFLLVLIAVVIVIVFRKRRDKERRKKQAMIEKAEENEVCHNIRSTKLSVHEYSEIDISDSKAGLKLFASGTATDDVSDEDKRERIQISDIKMSKRLPQKRSFHEYCEIETYDLQMRQKMSESESEMHLNNENKFKDQSPHSSVVVVAARKKAELYHVKDKICRDDKDKSVQDTHSEHVYFILAPHTDDDSLTEMYSTLVPKERQNHGNFTDNNHEVSVESTDCINNQRGDVSLSLQAMTTDRLCYRPTVEQCGEDAIPVNTGISTPVMHITHAASPNSEALDSVSESLTQSNASASREVIQKDSDYRTTPALSRKSRDNVTINKDNNDKAMINSILHDSIDKALTNDQQTGIHDLDELVMIDNELYESGNTV